MFNVPPAVVECSLERMKEREREREREKERERQRERCNRPTGPASGEPIRGDGYSDH